MSAAMLSSTQHSLAPSVDPPTADEDRAEDPARKKRKAKTSAERQRASVARKEQHRIKLETMVKDLHAQVARQVDEMEALKVAIPTPTSTPQLKHLDMAINEWTALSTTIPTRVDGIRFLEELRDSPLATEASKQSCYWSTNATITTANRSSIARAWGIDLAQLVACEASPPKGKNAAPTFTPDSCISYDGWSSSGYGTGDWKAFAGEWEAARMGCQPTSAFNIQAVPLSREAMTTINPQLGEGWRSMVQEERQWAWGCFHQGSITGAHIDSFLGGGIAYLVSGKSKVWLFAPPTEANLKWLLEYAQGVPCNWRVSPIGNLEGLEYAVQHPGEELYIPPGYIHYVLTSSQAIHYGTTAVEPETDLSMSRMAAKVFCEVLQSSKRPHDVTVRLVEPILYGLQWWKKHGGALGDVLSLERLIDGEFDSIRELAGIKKKEWGQFK